MLGIYDLGFSRTVAEQSCVKPLDAFNQAFGLDIIGVLELSGVDS
ncbi:hypothetical protein ES703_99579 [subsurface metagenome]